MATQPSPFAPATVAPLGDGSGGAVRGGDIFGLFASRPGRANRAIDSSLRRLERIVFTAAAWGTRLARPLWTLPKRHALLSAAVGLLLLAAVQAFAAAPAAPTTGPLEWPVTWTVTIGVLLGLVHLSNRTLRHRARRLELLVATRTAQLAARNTELARLLQLELGEKAAARRDEERARLHMLRYQLDPHFLFNTLASIRTALPAGPCAARGMMDRLVEFCRLTLHQPGDPDWTTLGDEIRLLRSYLAIEQFRWGDLLEIEIACDPALDRERLPQFMLLPLVENALKYGRATSRDRVGFRLSVRREATGGAGAGDRLAIEIANTGEWVEASREPRGCSLGIGIRNLRERLARYYPQAHHVEIAHPAGWVSVTLKLDATAAGIAAPTAAPRPAGAHA
jgi:signal transduction histidine kinase